MIQLNYLSHDTKDGIIMDLDYQVGEQQEYIEFLIEEHRKELKAMTCKRDYWRTKYNETIEPGTIRSIAKPVVVKPKKEFKINVHNKRPLKVKKSTKHAVKSTAGNLTGSKHSGHKTKDEVLVGIFPDGSIIEFDAVNEAKDYIRKTYKEFKKSPLTNISRAARKSGFYKDNGGMAYNIIWSYRSKDELIVE